MTKILMATGLAALALGVSLVGSPTFAAPAGQGNTVRTAPYQQAADATTVKTPARFEFYQREGLPAEYRGKTNPYQPSVPTVIKGADRYNARCASCHGLMGFGDGDASGALRTRPADLAWSLSDPRLKDDYLFWTISEGGAQFGTSMPAYKKPDLADWQIWELITYMRAAFEGREARAVPPRGGAQQAMRNVTVQAE
jgi:mono/diheme cytochrome c family protein